MFRKMLFSVLLIVLALTIFFSPTFGEIAAGAAILLFGMIMLENGFKSFVEGPLQVLLRKATNKLYKSFSLGFLVTALLQSSSLISVIAISFLSAGLIDLFAGIGIIFGSNIGTTATAWLVAVFGLEIKVSLLTMPLFTFGILFVLQRSKTFKGIGYVLGGLGFFFLGIHFMKEGFDIYQDNINLADYAIAGFWGLIIYSFIGVLITLVLQSSSAAMALILTALATGQINYDSSLSLAIGANVGTTITAILGALGSNIAGKKLAGAHFIFNVITGLLALIFISPLRQFVDFVSNTTGIVGDNYTLKLAVFHTVFNLAGVIIMMPFIRLLVKLLNKVFKEKETSEHIIELPVYLNDGVLAYPESALKAVRDESKRLFENGVFEIASHGVNIHRADLKGSEGLKRIVKNSNTEIGINIDEVYYQKVKTIYSKIIEFTTIAQSKFTMSPELLQAFVLIKLANRKMVESIKDLRGLRKNVNQYMNSENQYIAKEYNKLRRKMSTVLREIYLMRQDENPSSHLKRLGKLKKKADKNDVLIDGTLDRLIREQKISSNMATSLANDSDNISGVSKKLIEAAELLYINSDTFLEIEEN